MALHFWCIVAAWILVYSSKLPVAAAMQRAGGYDNRHPRAQQATLTGWGARSVAAHQNSFETFAPFAAAVLVAHLAGGSDCPVEPPHPLRGMALARDRAGLVPEEGLSASSALRLFTAGAAAALGEPPPLTAGSRADLIVLDRDPVSSTSDELRDTAVIATLVDGVEVAIDPGHEVWVG